MKLYMDEKDLAKLFSKLFKEDFKSRTELGKPPIINEVALVIESDNFEICFQSGSYFQSGAIYIRDKKCNYHIVVNLYSKDIVVKNEKAFTDYGRKLVSTNGKKVRKVFEELKRMFFTYKLTNETQRRLSI